MPRWGTVRGAVGRRGRGRFGGRLGSGRRCRGDGLLMCVDRCRCGGESPAYRDQPSIQRIRSRRTSARDRQARLWASSRLTAPKNDSARRCTSSPQRCRSTGRHRSRRAGRCRRPRCTAWAARVGMADHPQIGSAAGPRRHRQRVDNQVRVHGPGRLPRGVTAAERACQVVCVSGGGHGFRGGG